MTMLHSLVLAFATLAVACGSSPGAGGPDPVDTGVLPTWELQDVQPLSPMSGQTYGLDAFTDHVVVVTLVTGF